MEEMASNYKAKELIGKYIACCRRGIKNGGHPYDIQRCYQLIDELQFLFIKKTLTLTEFDVETMVDRFTRPMDYAFLIRAGFEKYSKKKADEIVKKKRARDNRAVMTNYDIRPKKLDDSMVDKVYSEYIEEQFGDGEDTNVKRNSERKTITVDFKKGVAIQTDDEGNEDDS